MNVIPQLSRIYDEPFADSSQPPVILVSAFTRQHVTMAMPSDAGMNSGADATVIPGRNDSASARSAAADRSTQHGRSSSAVKFGNVGSVFCDRQRVCAGVPAGAGMERELHKLALAISARSSDMLYHGFCVTLALCRYGAPRR